MIGWEPGVIESRSQPASRVVASRASSRETRRCVVRVVGAVVVGLMARVAVRGNRGVVVVNVALRTRPRKLMRRSELG